MFIHKQNNQHWKPVKLIILELIFRVQHVEISLKVQYGVQEKVSTYVLMLEAELLTEILWSWGCDFLVPQNYIWKTFLILFIFSAQEYDQLVVQQKEIEEKIQDLEANPPR